VLSGDCNVSRIDAAVRVYVLTELGERDILESLLSHLGYVTRVNAPVRGHIANKNFAKGIEKSGLQ
jgi:hypothetical protein